MRIALLLAVAVVSTPAPDALAQARQKDHFVSVYSQPVTCRINLSAHTVRMTMHTGHMSRDRSGRNFYLWRAADGREVTWKGSGETDQPGFWFGELNGKTAGGYTLSRGHWVFETQGAALQFECWEKGYEHGSY